MCYNLLNFRLEYKTYKHDEKVILMMLEADQFNQQEMIKEKNAVAKSSVLAAVLLTGMKFIVGYSTGSLGIISEALHSGLDFVAAFITYIAVKLSSKPPDEKYNYGRGKVESFSALIETLLLLATCIWIIHEATDRLRGQGGEVETNIWAFLVMGISIIIDYSRSTALYRVAKKYNSQALMADALHFSSDILSSAVVIIGLIFVKIGYPYGDPIAALAVAVLVIFASYRLGKETINCLMDRAPEGLSQKIEDTVLAIENVSKIERLRVRVAGSETFVDANISVSRALPLEQAHKIANDAEIEIQKILPGADVLIHLDPIDIPSESMINKVIAIAYKHTQIKETHNITFLKLENEKLCLELHVEVDPDLTLVEAHNIVTAFEKELLHELPMLSSINTHIDIVSNGSIDCKTVGIKETDIIKKIESIVNNLGDKTTKCTDIKVRMSGKDYFASIQCVANPDLKIVEAHEICDQIELKVQNSVKNLKYVLVHIEPKQ